MFTRDSKILSHRLTTPLTSVANAVGDVFKPTTIDMIIRPLFANGEQGFFYDPNDLSTMFQDAAGATPVTGAGRPVGLVLDKSKGLVLGEELVINGSFDDLTSWALDTSSGLSITGGQAVFAVTPAYKAFRQLGRVVSGKWYRVVIDVAEITQGSIYIPDIVVTPITTSGIKSYIVRSNTTNVFLMTANSGATAKVNSVSIKEISGNHAYQTTSSMRPLLVASPQRLDFDTVDDKLITNLPAQLTGCTVVRAIPNVGTQILTSQTIPTPYNDNTDHCGLIVINRALTATETSQITKLFNKAAGV